MRELLAWNNFDAASGWRAETLANADGTNSTAFHGPAMQTSAPFDQAVPSWSAATPAGSWIEVRLRVRRGERWSAFYRIAEWDNLPAGSARHSFEGQRDADGWAATDTLVSSAPADAIQPLVLLHGQATLHGLWIALSGPGALGAPGHTCAPHELAVPPRAQLDYPNGGEICSPTSIGMLLAYWYTRIGSAQLAPFADSSAVAELVAPQVYDPVYEGYGNWSFNTAFASSLGLTAYVARLETLAQVSAWVAAGVPVVISVAWQAGTLDGAPIAASNGHLLVVTGFDERGRVIVADPRGESVEQVRRLYDPEQLQNAWQRNSSGTVYLIYPDDWPVPDLAMPMARYLP